MPLNSQSDYPGVLTVFLSHWKSVEEELGEVFLTRLGGRADGLALRAELEGAVSAVRATAQQVAMLRWELKRARGVARGRLDELNTLVRGFWSGTDAEALVPNLPPVGAATGRFLKPCRVGWRLWGVLDAGPPPPGMTLPVMLREGFSRADFKGVLEAVVAAEEALEEGEFVLRTRRLARDGVMLRVKDLLVAFTKGLPVKVGEEDALFTAMPRLWPLPGHTPEPVEARGVWLEEGGRVRLEWEGSLDAMLAYYQVRGCAGGIYRQEDEFLLGRVERDGERVFERAFPELPVGGEVSFKVYVVLTTGNERGSEAVVVERVASDQ